MNDCVFCKIVAGELPSQQVYSDERVIVFHDIFPEAPIHLVVIPRTHVVDFAQLSADEELAGHLVKVATQVAQSVTSEGYRLVMNTGRDGGQTVFHAHMHILGGRSLQWPPG